MENLVLAIAPAIPAAGFWDILVTPLGWIFQGCYWLIPNFVAAIFLFALFFKVVLFPLDIKRQKAQAKMARFQPRIAAIQKKYANDQARQQEELQKLYTEEGYNPAGGCLPSLLPLPIFFGLYAVIRRPLTYLVGMSEELLAEGQAVLESLGTAITNTYYVQLDMLRQFRLTPDAFSAEFAEAIGDFEMSLFGLDLTGYIGMEGQSWVYWLFPIFTVLTQIASSYVVGKFSQKNNEGMPGANAAMNPFMLFGMPILTGLITYKFPAGVMLYWIFNSLLMMVSNIVLNTCWPIKKLAAKYEEEAKRNPRAGKTSKFREKLMAAQKNNAELEKQYLEQAELSNRRKKELERRLIANARENNQSQVEVQDIPNPIETKAGSVSAPSKEAREAYLRMLESQKKKKKK
ncbi:MAG: YidC/Oxa1 family membrane protein insertase [Clostridia bacterium]|nr:YidC/Oxa1 family membrane protein insertase [Clostridia bacterium]